MARAYVGIDPGIHGTVAVISPAGTVQFHDFPTNQVAVRSGRGKAKMRSVPDEPAIAQIFRGIRDGFAAAGVEVFVTLERVTAMPAKRKGAEPCRECGNVPTTQGPTSMFTFGYGYGLCAAMLAAFELSHRRVMPHVWKGALLANTARGKGAEMAVAGQLYPGAGPQLRGPRGGILDGRVDALLIAHFGRVQDRAGDLIT